MLSEYFGIYWREIVALDRDFQFWIFEEFPWQGMRWSKKWRADPPPTDLYMDIDVILRG
jgi:hypothetical protein